MVDKCLESIYLLDEIEVCMKHVTNISNVTVVQKEKIVTTMTRTTTRTRKPRDHHYEPLLVGWIKGAR